MRSIEPLPDAVRSSVRSGIILFDLTRVVEELIFNSLDAGATKVSVFLSVGTCYVKVVDDGSGITRDGLVLLGERYATSKLHHFADMDAASGSFGFRGEALASISDVSLLEVVTKAYGRPNGYRKVMKGCKCLYLGIDDESKGVGTTVVVRDLFYNQPVRRKYMQSSPKKVLHSVKKSVFRIALVHPKVSFKVVDIESEDELLCTHPSSSPSSLLMSGFGIEVSSNLHELDVGDGVLRLSGYVSGPCDSFAIKAFQYVYINSRFICKGPIHRLLNQLATRFECLDPWKVNNGSQKGKRSRSQVHPAYILNLSCPRSLYDLTFEPSKTYVEFKDLVPILTFIEKAIQHLWKENITNGESFNHAVDLLGKDEMWNKDGNAISAKEDLSENSEVAKKKSRIQNHQASLCLPSSPLECVPKEGKHVSKREHDQNPNKKLHQNIAELESQTEMELVHQTGYSFQSWDGSYAVCKPTGTQKSENDLWTCDNNFISAGDSFVKNKFPAAERSNDYVEDNILSSTWGDGSLKVDLNASNVSAGSPTSYEYHEFSKGVEVGKDIRKPFLQSCSSRGTLPLDRALLASDEIFEFQIDGFRAKRKWTRPDDRVDILEVDVSNQNYDFLSMALRQDEASYAQPFPRLEAKGDMSADFDVFSRASAKSFTSYTEDSAEDSDLRLDSVTQVGNFDLGHHSLHSEWCSVTSDPLFQAMPWDVEYFTDKNALKGDSRCGKKASNRHFVDSEEKDFKFSYDIVSKSSSQENCTSICTTTLLDFNDYAGSSKDICKSLQGRNLDSKNFPQHSEILMDETGWLCFDLCGKDYTDIDKYERQRHRLQYQDCEQNHVRKERSRRSHSAPPFYRHKRRFISLNHHSTTKAGKPDAQTFHDAFTSPEAGELKHPQQSCGVRHLYFEPSVLEDLSIDTRSDINKMPDITPDMKEIQKDFISKEFQDSLNSDTKWQNSCPQTANKDKLHDIHDRNNILDISSEFLHLAGDSLVPESINKNCLEDAKVLQQVDKKFIPVVAGGTLAVIDQHAADERIRLEELRRKILSGEAKTITHLDAEQELILPEIGYQLLHNYAEQIEDWGWICNILAQGSRSFKKNEIPGGQSSVQHACIHVFDTVKSARNLNILHRQPTVVTLLAVPCILGVNLSDVDLLEFLQQLADTDGSSTMPPSVLRVLNSKACRGAIMFGDSLLPSECSLIVEELKQTSLCFQCAHGRPTTVPLVNLGALHKQIAKLRSLNDGSNKLWHGLCRHELSLERAARRLSSSTCHC